MYRNASLSNTFLACVMLSTVSVSVFRINSAFSPWCSTHHMASATDRHELL